MVNTSKKENISQMNPLNNKLDGENKSIFSTKNKFHIFLLKNAWGLIILTNLLVLLVCFLMVPGKEVRAITTYAICLLPLFIVSIPIFKVILGRTCYQFIIDYKKYTITFYTGFNSNYEYYVNDIRKVIVEPAQFKILFSNIAIILAEDIVDHFLENLPIKVPVDLEGYTDKSEKKKWEMKMKGANANRALKT